jgi:hypothetical protein
MHAKLRTLDLLKIFLDIAGLEEESKFYHEAHLHVSGVEFDLIMKEIIIHIQAKDEDDSKLLETFFISNLEKELQSVNNILSENNVIYDKIKCDIIIDNLFRKLSKQQVELSDLNLEEKVIEIEKRTGYIPNLVIDKEDVIFITYETISQTRKELQSEILNILYHLTKIFQNKNIIYLTINRIYNHVGTLGEKDSEIIRLITYKKDYDNYLLDKLNKREYWNKLNFYRKIILDIYDKRFQKINWKLAL